MACRVRFFLSSVKHIFRFERSVGAVFDFEDGGGFDDFYAVPLACGDLYSVVALRRVEEVAGGLSAEIVVEDDVHFATEDDIGFGSVAVAVYGKRSAGEEYVDEALGLGVEAVVKIVVHAEAGASGGLSGHFVEEFVVDDHDCCCLDLR